jgi:hypothetical protein
MESQIFGISKEGQKVSFFNQKVKKLKIAIENWFANLQKNFIFE